MLASLLIAAVAAGSSDTAIASQSRIPTPAAHVITAPCPDVGGACALPGERLVYLPAGATRFTRQHELGHIFDAEYLDAGERNRLQRLLGVPRGPWFAGTGDAGVGSPSELFADAFSTCRLMLDPRRGTWHDAYGYEPTRRQHRQVCATIRRAARDLA